MGSVLLDHKVILDFFGPWGWRAAHLARMVVWRMTRPQRIGVTGLVFNEAGQVLLVENSYAKGWRLAGGGVERGETAEASLIREMQEEVGITPTRLKFQGIFLHEWCGSSNQIITYVIEAYEGTPKADGIEILRIIWADPANLPEGTEAGLKRRLAEVLQGEAVSPRW